MSMLLALHMEFVYFVPAEYYLVCRLFARDVERQSDCCQLRNVPVHQQTAQLIPTAVGLLPVSSVIKLKEPIH